MASGTNGGGSKTATPAETVHSHSLSNESFAADAPVGVKICCICGRDVAHAERFKDKKGRYWCYECGVQDSKQRHANDQIKCPDCGQEFSQKDLVEYEGHHLCQGCSAKRAKAAKRELARKSAAEEAARDAERQRKRIIVGSVAFAVIAIGVAAWAIFL